MQQDTSAGRTGLEIHVHPLVILNISDHWTRAQVYAKRGSGSSAGSSGSRTIGAILGTQIGKTVAFRSSFPIPCQSSGAPDWKYLETKFKMQKEVYESYEILGWYSAGACDLKADTVVHQQLIRCGLNEDFSPLYLTIDVHDEQTANTLPIKIFESELVQNPDTEALDLAFNQIPFVIETEESERVAVDELARANKAASAASDTPLASHLTGVCESLENVEKRIATLTDFLEQTRDGRLPYDHATLRKISALVSSLPSSDDGSVQSALQHDYNDTLLVVLLAAVTKAAAAMDAAQAKTNVLAKAVLSEGSAHRRRGPMGMSHADIDDPGSSRMLAGATRKSKKQPRFIRPHP